MDRQRNWRWHGAFLGRNAVPCWAHMIAVACWLRARTILLSVLLVFVLSSAVRAELDIPPARVQEIARWLPAQPAGFGRPITDRAAWEKLRSAKAFGGIIAEAERLARKPVPALPDDLYLDFSRTGNRDRCQKVMFERTDRIVNFTLAECLENRGRFMGPLTETIELLCQEKSWEYPAHDGSLDVFYGRTVEMDLRATSVARELATVDYLLGDKLPPATRRLLRGNVERRVLQPFHGMVEGRRKEVHWLRVQNNWNAVCLAGTVGAALALEDSPEARAWFIAAAEKYIQFFLRGFTPDGYCSEGIGYWNYGFGHFLSLGEEIRQATGGHVDLLALPQALQPALFCTRAEVVNGIYPTISDSHLGSQPSPRYVCYISQRLDLAQTGDCAVQYLKPDRSLADTMMFAFLPSPLPVVPRPALPAASPLRTWFTNGQVLICRPASGVRGSFAAVLKGGNNAENHNHNDVGSFSAVAGASMVICDPGAEVYTRRTFSAHRYDSKVLSSYGHAVPVVAGQLQQPGREAQARVLRAEFSDQQDTLALDIRSAYKVPELRRLERTFVYHRAVPASLTVRDEGAFTKPESFQTALITWGKCKQVSSNELVLTDTEGSVRVRIETDGAPFTVASETLDEDMPDHRKPLRIGITLSQPVDKAVVTLTIGPEEQGTQH
jgi:hypothetical protein